MVVNMWFSPVFYSHDKTDELSTCFGRVLDVVVV